MVYTYATPYYSVAKLFVMLNKSVCNEVAARVDERRTKEVEEVVLLLIAQMRTLFSDDSRRYRRVRS